MLIVPANPLIRQRRRAFSLVELVVVIAIMGILIGLLLPAIQQVRASARRVACANHLRQLGIGLANYESSFQEYPTSFDVLPGQVVRGSWSIHAKILPMMEQSVVHANIDFNVDWHEQTETPVPSFGVPVYSCPSDYQAGNRFKDGRAYVHSTSYGFNMGTWFIYDPVTGQGGDGAFRVGKPTRHGYFDDGLSNTLAASDVKSFTSYIRNASSINESMPSDPNHFDGVSAQLKLGPAAHDNTGHTVWCDGRVHHAGFTTTFRPNTRVLYESGGQIYDIDYNSQQEGRDLVRPTYAAVTARSHHVRGINVSRMDGSVGFISQQIDLLAWRSLGTADGGEVSWALP